MTDVERREYLQVVIGIHLVFVSMRWPEVKSEPVVSHEWAFLNPRGRG